MCVNLQLIAKPCVLGSNEHCDKATHPSVPSQDHQCDDCLFFFSKKRQEKKDSPAEFTNPWAWTVNLRAQFKTKGEKKISG